MYRTTPSLEALKGEMRRRICTDCPHRPPHSEMLGPEAVRSCEQSCPLFSHLPMLRRIALLTDPMLRSRREMVRQWVARLCEIDPTITDSPLNCELDRVLDAVSRALREH
jgi:hypothetical protein